MTAGGRVVVGFISRRSTAGNVSEMQDLAPVVAFDLLSASRRVAAAVAVEAADEPVSSGELATMTAAAEHGRPPGKLGGRSAGSVKSALERDHLPRLVAHDVLRDADGGYEAGANMEGFLSVVDESLDQSGDGPLLTADGRQPGGPVPDTDI